MKLVYRKEKLNFAKNVRFGGIQNDGKANKVLEAWTESVNSFLGSWEEQTMWYLQIECAMPTEKHVEVKSMFTNYLNTGLILRV